MSASPRDAVDSEIHNWKFGSIEFRTQGAGVFFASDKLKARIMALSYAEAKDANDDAWQFKREAERGMDHYSNVTLHGVGTYDRFAHGFYVADQIRKITWQRMQVES